MTVDMTTRSSWGRGRRAGQLFCGWFGWPAVAAGLVGVLEVCLGFGRRWWGIVRASRAYGDITIYRSPASVFAVFGAPATVIPACAGFRRCTSPAMVMEAAGVDSGFRRDDGWGEAV